MSNQATIEAKLTRAAEWARWNGSITLAIVDRKIDAVHDELKAREPIDEMSAESWGRAWARQPRLRAREKLLYVRRFTLQVERDQRAYQAAQKAEREAKRADRKRYSVKPKQCPTCGFHTLAA